MRNGGVFRRERKSGWENSPRHKHNEQDDASCGCGGGGNFRFRGTVSKWNFVELVELRAFLRGRARNREEDGRKRIGKDVKEFKSKTCASSDAAKTTGLVVEFGGISGIAGFSPSFGG